MKVIWLANALARRDAAIERIAEDDARAAQGQLDEIERQTARLPHHPELGRPADPTGTRRLGIARTPFVILYRIRPRAQRIEIFRFIHTSQDWQS